MQLRVENGPLVIGSTFADKYEIKGLLGHGGQAWVYRGQHTFTGREVAIKVIHSPGGVTREMLDRAKAEAQALAKLNHTNVVIMHDAGVTAEGLLYILMELLDGCSLGAVLKEYGRLTIEETLRLAIQAADAVHEAHKRRIIHRDLKPDNLFVIRSDGHGNPLKVLDFGIAKMLDEIGFTTRKDVVIGTVLYMSPEQVQGLPITEQSDIYALGLIIWELLTGKRPSVLIFERDLIERGEPFRRPGIADIPPIQAHRIPPLLTELDPEIPIYVAQLVQRAIAKVARQRFSTMGDFATAMRVCLDRYLKELPPRVRQLSVRDLSQPSGKSPETAPVSQRATAKHLASASPVSAARTARLEHPVGSQNALAMKPSSEARQRRGTTSSSMVGIDTQPMGTSLAAMPEAQPARSASRPESQRAGAANQTIPAAPAAKAVQATPNTRPPASGPLKPATPPPVAVNPREMMRSGVGHANRVKIRSALVSASILGVALGAALMRPTTRAESLPSAALGTVAEAAPLPNTIAVPLPSIPPAARASANTGAEAAATVASVVQLPISAAPAQQIAIPATHTVAPSTKAAAPKPADKMDQRLIELENDLGSEPSANPKPAASAAQNKSWVQPREERKKAIYGD